MKRVVIAGHRGRMGRLLMDRLSRQPDVEAAGIDLPFSEEDVAEACRGAHAVILCVPASAIEEAAETFVPHMEEDAILSDIASVKELPMAAMERLWPGPVVGTHPLFGPAPAAGMELRVSIVPGKKASEPDIAFIEGLFQSFGCTAFRTTAEKHDLAQAKIQGLNFITSAVYFAMTAEDPDLRPFITPSFQLRLDASEKLLTEDGPLFIGLFEENPHSRPVMHQFLDMLTDASSGGMAPVLGRAQQWWKEKAEKDRLEAEKLQPSPAGLEKE